MACKWIRCVCCSFLFLPALTYAQLDCSDPVTHLISQLQGETETSPLANSNVRVKGIVVGDFQGAEQLGGFFLQEELADQDANPLTSEGVFVFEGDNPVRDVSYGEVVMVEGTVREYNGLTELINVQIASCDATEQPIPEVIQDWSNGAAERYEGMLVQFPDSLFVTDIGNLARFGELELVAGGRQFQYTQINTPSAEALAYEAQMRDRRVLLDDQQNGSTQRPVFFLQNNPLLRAGYFTENLIGVLDYGFGAYRLRPLSPVVFSGPAFPSGAPLDTGNLRIATFNLENYFNGNSSGSFSGSRGAGNQAEFTLQTLKLVEAIRGLDAAIIGIQEVENDYFQDGLSAAATLVDALNAAAREGERYAYIDAGPSIGSDVIAVGILYRADLVQPVGEPAILSDPPVLFLLNATNRSPLAQTFQAGDEEVLVVVNHFKSKAPSSYDTRLNADPLDDDQGDGQGYWNRMRTRGAEAVLSWVEQLTEGQNDPRIAILGDLNAYSQEDPVRTLEEAGYINVLEDTYTIDFDGFWGMLDHILVSPALHADFLAAATWPINADESDIRNYASSDPSFVEETAIRSSDHDPLVAAFAVEGLVTHTAAPLIRRGWQVIIPPQNPAHGTLQWAIQSDRPVQLTLEIMDIAGRRLLQQRHDLLFAGQVALQAEASTLPMSGLYFWRLRDARGHQVSGKLIRR